MKLYGFGSRGIATFPPNVPRGTLDVDTPIPLFTDRAAVQGAIDRDAKDSYLTVIEYELQVSPDPEQIAKFTELVLKPTRSAMRRAIGDRTSRQYDIADLVAEGVAAGVRQAFEKMPVVLR